MKVINIQSASTPSSPASHIMSSGASSESIAVTGAIAGSLILAGAACTFYLVYWLKRKPNTKITPLTLEANSLQRSENLSGPTHSAIPSVLKSSYPNPSHNLTPSTQTNPQPEPTGPQTRTEREAEDIQSQMTQLHDEMARVRVHLWRLEAQIELDARETEEDTSPPPRYVS
ncbi:hypothetical protein BDP27DRAFT_34378 [Rhodocollybia butyracea]|uniref:Uncharacterized protein n=1 Tax=Rhodocollybia butyracea TaxID=206335 RepID=A0A9P5Q6S1_9AGAR|nr:hypothetical protein BDP27DRAFT_34378 [Rhodocollybia butyracea]